MENKEQRVWIIVTIITVSVLVLIFAGITYAFFTTSDNTGSTAEIISDSGKMIITYGDGTNTLVIAEDISPSSKIIADKTFNLTGTNTTDGLMMPFSISLEYQNTFKNMELLCFLKRVDNSENVVVDLIDLLGIGGPLTQEFLEQFDYDLPQDLVGYYFNAIADWSNNPFSQEIASGYFKANSDSETLTLNLKMLFIDMKKNQDYNKGATFNGKIVIKEDIPTEEITESWSEIATNVKNGNGSKYKVGDTKEVEIDGTSYTLRVANNTTPSECSGNDFSQTACGLVFEFVDIVEERQMNSTWTNEGGWPATELRTYANGEFLNKLPSELQNVIIDTKVISGHGSVDTSNFISTDKIYLLSSKEIWNGNEYDSAVDSTRQLDFYANKGVTENFFSKVQKNFNGANSAWWLRSAHSNRSHSFLTVDSGGAWGSDGASTSYGFAPAFRIG